MMKQSAVAIVRTTPDTVIADYNRLVRLLLPAPLADSGALLVAVIERQFPFPAQSTPPWQLEGVARALRAHRYTQLHLQLTKPDPDDRHALQPVARKLALEPALPTNRASDLVVALSTLRRGSGVAFSGATRLALAFARHRATLAVIDGTTVGNGPAHKASHPEIGNILIASLDPVAADTIAATLLGLQPMLDIPHLQVAHECGIGTADLAQIRLLGDHELATLRWPIHPAPRRRPWDSVATIARQFSSTVPRFSRLRQYTHTDFNAWTTTDRERYTSWLYDTVWGQLFVQYQREAGMPARA